MDIPIVNDHDEIIGHKNRSELDYANDIFRTASLWITNGHGDILLAQRKHDKKVDPGKWAEAVGGTVEGGDSYEQTVIREAEEELGITGADIAIGPKQYITVPAKYFVQWYTAVVDAPIESFVIQEDEVERIAWVSTETLERELVEKPEKYIAPMSEIVALFK